ncbi:hypothetical protein INT45_009001 [Circinella minor]|uniref:Uncharacterized protein n=1 Tax=Circinella minor TaxID=1195481 RepID=A0A8H7VQI8_9FUNG|nr:hypothetical protein INT45_009001 [Circinella minor]
MTTAKNANKPRMSTLFPTEQEDYDEPTPTSRLTFTPCTRMSNLTLASQSNTTEHNGRTRIFTRHQRPATDFNTKLKRAFGNEDSSPQRQQSHPNLSMVLGGEKISFDDSFQRDMNTRGMFFQSSEDESEDDDEDLLKSFSSPEQSPSASPERFTLDSIFDMDVNLPSPTGFGEEDDEDEVENSQITTATTVPRDNDEHYDPTLSWVNQVYEDVSPDVYDMMSDEGSAYFADDDKSPIAMNNTYTVYDDENRPPPPPPKSALATSTKRGKTRSWEYSNRNSSSSNSSSSSSPLPENKRTPLQELPLEEIYDDNDDLHPRKKVILNKKTSIHSVNDNDYRAPISSSSTSRSRKPFMRALSPSSICRYKGKEPASN